MMEDYLHKDKSEILENYENWGIFCKKFIELLVENYSDSLERALKFKNYLSGYHNTRCKYVQLEEGSDYKWELQHIIDTYCDEDEIISHFSCMVVNGQASYEGLC